MADEENVKVPSEEKALTNVVDESVETTEEMEPINRNFENNEPVEGALKDGEEGVSAKAGTAPEASDVPAEEAGDAAEEAPAAVNSEPAAEPAASDVPAEETGNAAEEAPAAVNSEPVAEPAASDVPAEEAGNAAEEAPAAASSEPVAEPAASDVPAEEAKDEAGAAPAAAGSVPVAEPAASDVPAEEAKDEADAAPAAAGSVPAAGAPAGEKKAETQAMNRAAVSGAEAPPKKGRNGLLIGLIIAVTAVIVIAAVFYMRYFIPKEIHVNTAFLDLTVGDTAKLEYSIVPASADNLEVAWASSNPEVAVIDEFGVVTAVSGGECAIAVATGNGKTDVCKVTVTDPAQIQKNALSKVNSFISEKASADENGLKTYTVSQIDEKHSFLMGTDGAKLYLIYRSKDAMEEMGVEAQYSTYVVLSPENIDTAEVKQEDILYVYGFPISMIGSGSMNLGTYQHGDQVPLSNISSDVTGLDATEALHELTDRGSTICLDRFAELLGREGFDFTLAEFGFKNYGALEAPKEVKSGDGFSLTASEAQESWDTISEEDLISGAESAAAASAAAAQEALSKEFFSSKPDAGEAKAETQASDELNAEELGSENRGAENSGTIFQIPSVGHGFSFDIAKASSAAESAAAKL